MSAQDVEILWNGAVLPLNTTWSRKREMKFAGSGEPTTVEQTYNIDGTIPLAATDNPATVWSAFEARFDGANGYGKDLLVRTTPGHETIHSLAATACRKNGPRARVLENPTAPAMYATHIPYRIEVAGETEIGASDITGVLQDEMTTTYEYDRHGKCTRTIEGWYITKKGISAYGKRTLYVPATPSGYERIRTSFKKNNDDDRVDYAFVDVQFWIALPPGVTDGSVTSSVRVSGMKKTLRVSGNLSGINASNAADAYQIEQLTPSVLEKTKTPRSGSVSFTYEYETSNAGAEAQRKIHVETISKRGPGYNREAVPIIGDNPPQIQLNYRTACRITQSGRITSNTQPTAPSPLWSLSEFGDGDPAETREIGEDNLYHLSYEYSFLFAEDQTASWPSVDTDWPTGRGTGRFPLET